MLVEGKIYIHIDTHTHTHNHSLLVSGAYDFSRQLYNIVLCSTNQNIYSFMFASLILYHHCTSILHCCCTSVTCLRMHVSLNLWLICPTITNCCCFWWKMPVALQDPNNRNVVNCDDKLKSILLGKPQVELAELPMLIKLHFPKVSK